MTPQKRKPAGREPVDPSIVEWFAHWQRVGAMLEERRLEELRNMTAEERRRRIAAVLGLVTFPRPDRATSGLVEYYRKLRKLRT